MSVLTIKRVSVLPASPAANTTYLIAVAGGNDLQVAVTNGNGTVVKKSLLRSEIVTMINSAITKSEVGAVAAINAALAEAKSYTNSGLAAEVTRSNAYADQAELDAIAAANAAAEAAMAIEAAARSLGDSSTEQAAAAYTDNRVTNEATDRINGDAGVLASAKSYTDSSIAAEVTRSNTYADNAVAAGIASLDLSATVQYAEDIASRDTLAAGLTKSSLIFVVNASADATVNVGSALYFYDTVGETFTKVSEYESLDLVIPNKLILESFSVVNNRLHLDGKPISTVDFDFSGSTW